MNKMVVGKAPFILVLASIRAIHCVVHPDGVSKVSGYQDDLGNYKFGYTVSSVDGEHFHSADKDTTGRVIGSYGLTEADGRHRVVDYIADQGGFRAHIRSNEPGLASSRSESLTIIKTDDTGGPQLDFAASDSSSSSAGLNYGERVKETGSRVSYVRPSEDEPYRRRLPLRVIPDEDKSDTLTNERRRPTIGVNLGTTRSLSSRRRLIPFQQEHIPDSPSSGFLNTRLLSSGEYQPPLDPFKAIQSPLIPQSLDPSRGFPPQPAAPQPSTPPYGGFETRDPFLYGLRSSFFGNPAVTQRYSQDLAPRNRVTGYPVVSMSTIHGGFTRIPQSSLSRSRFPEVGRDPGILPFHQQGYAPPQQNLPLVSDISGQPIPGRPNLILRAVAIPNGIQAVPVNPSTGQVQNMPEFPIYNPQDGTNRDTDEGRFSIPGNNFRSTSPELNVRNFVNRQQPQSFGPTLREELPRPEFFRNSSYDNDYNRINNIPDETSLSRPSTKDLALISKVFREINGHHNAKQPADPHSFRNMPPHFHRPLPDYPPTVRYPQHRDNFNAQFPEFRSGTGPEYNPVLLRPFPGPSHGHDSSVEDGPSDFEHPYFDEDLHLNSREYRSASNRRSASDDNSPSAAETVTRLSTNSTL